MFLNDSIATFSASLCFLILDMQYKASGIIKIIDVARVINTIKNLMDYKNEFNFQLILRPIIIDIMIIMIII